MAYIAPSLWTVNQYGEGLRSLVRRGRHLDRWLDFKSHQIFEDVITYTALQFYTREPQEVVRIAAAPNGEMAEIDWSDAELAVPYDSLPENGEWLMATGAERGLIERLPRDCLRLEDPSLTSGDLSGFRPAPTTSIISGVSGPVGTNARRKARERYLTRWKSRTRS